MLATRETTEMRKAGIWSGKTVLIIGIARQGIALARYLNQQGAAVVVNDRREIEQLKDAQSALEGIPAKWIVGGHPLSALSQVDLVCISGGVPNDLEIVVEAKNRGIPISNDSQIFLEECQCKVIGITGSAGKTTTTTLVGLIAQAAVEEVSNLTLLKEVSIPISPFLQADSKVWVGGNIGSPLISVLDQIQPADIAIMELSSFQLEIMDISPDIAVLLNISPNHLDRHKTMDNYIAAKSKIINYQTSQDIAVLNLADEEVNRLIDDIQGQMVGFSTERLTGDVPGVYFDQDTNFVQLVLPSSIGREPINVIDAGDIPLRGNHNLMNVLAACAAAYACGISPIAMEVGVKRFSGIPHRLEFVRSFGGGDWYNDSIATAPERAIAAMEAFSEPLILLAGGRDKDLPWDRFVSIASQRVKHLILFGEAVNVITSTLSRYAGDTVCEVAICSDLKEAVITAAGLVTEGDVVLLSPGGTSFDEFIDFEQRGEAYKKWVMELV
jgi:UDP-N-acetylmuramoylalanine--D-glutamate ligase